MDYEKAYKAVLKTATQWIKDGCTDKEKICLEGVFPELRESEDEKTRTLLVALVQWAKTFNQSGLDHNTSNKMLSYLEKQKEQKPAWSEEDEKKIHFLSRLIEFQVKDGEYCFGEGSCAISKQEAIEMLQSLRPSWKPTPEQLDTLHTAAYLPEMEFYGGLKYKLRELYEHLINEL